MFHAPLPFTNVYPKKVCFKPSGLHTLPCDVCMVTCSHLWFVRASLTILCCSCQHSLLLLKANPCKSSPFNKVYLSGFSPLLHTDFNFKKIPIFGAIFFLWCSYVLNCKTQKYYTFLQQMGFSSLHVCLIVSIWTHFYLDLLICVPSGPFSGSTLTKMRRARWAGSCPHRTWRRPFRLELFIALTAWKMGPSNFHSMLLKKRNQLHGRMTPVK